MMHFEWELILRLGLALLFGSIIGFEREYRSKAAGFRTITIISLGAALFTICSFKLGAPGNPDRIASNIITGIGFIGAGVIFKDGLNVSGLTTAATIWIAAAIGMALGIGEYILATCALTLAIAVLALFEKLQDYIDAFHQVRTYRISLPFDYDAVKLELEAQLAQMKIGFKLKRSIRDNEEIILIYSLAGNQKELDKFSDYLLRQRDVKSFNE